MHGRNESRANNSLKNNKDKIPLETLCEPDSSNSGEAQITDCCNRGNKPLMLIGGLEFLD
jgi:hypothetical protein